MSYPGSLHSGRECPERNETAPPQALYSDYEVKSKFFEDIENRFLQLLKLYGIDRAMSLLESYDIVMAVQPDWHYRKRMIAMKMEEEVLREKMEQERKSRRKAAKPKPKAEMPNSDKPKTLRYYTHGNNSLLMKQRKRVDIVFKKWTEWKWIDTKTKAEDFDALFEGVPRHCNITWTAGNTILTILVQELLKQPYIEKQTRCSAKSLVEQQFGLTPNSDRNRLESNDEDKIKITLLILDVRNPLPEPRRGGNDESPDIHDAALKAVYKGQLRITKEV